MAAMHKPVGLLCVALSSTVVAPVAAQVSPTQASPTDRASSREADDQRTLVLGTAIGLGALGVATMTAAGVVSGIAASSWSDAEAACPGGNCPSRDAQRLSVAAAEESRIAVALWGAGGSALIGAGLLWLFAPDAPEPARVAVSLGPDAVGLSWTNDF